jgi:hypothetical protein
MDVLLVLLVPFALVIIPFNLVQLVSMVHRLDCQPLLAAALVLQDISARMEQLCLLQTHVVALHTIALKAVQHQLRVLFRQFQA